VCDETDARCGSRGLCGPNPQARSRANRAKNLLTVSPARSVCIRCRRHRYDTPAGNGLDWLISLTLIGPRKPYRRTNFRTARFGVARDPYAKNTSTLPSQIVYLTSCLLYAYLTLRSDARYYITVFATGADQACGGSLRPGNRIQSELRERLAPLLTGALYLLAVFYSRRLSTVAQCTRCALYEFTRHAWLARVA